MRILIANRGEIARRIIRTSHRLGHSTVAVYSEPDRRMPFVAEAGQAVGLGAGGLSESYLSTDKILAAAVETDSDAIHPGYGFLSENAEFARAVIDAGLTWIGPHPEAITAMGSKIEARQIAAEAGVPVIPGFDSNQDPDALRDAAERIGYPVLVKASAGGGGKGIRIAKEASDFDDALAAAKDESRRSFGDDRVIVERYITRPRHVEVQIIGDSHGNVTHLGTRECSVQRRYQKLLEEAPAPNLPAETRSSMQTAAVALAAQISYDSAGTVEFVVDDATGDFFFLEMNTRLQVEHPVTEHITGLDLVELQIRAAQGEVLDLGDVALAGHAFEVRINAEDAWADFAPQIGTVTDLVVPNGVRWDSGIVAGSEVTPHYDPMIAKLIVGGSDRETARRRMASALDGLVIGGLRTNAGFHRWLIDQRALVDGRVTTRFLDDTALPDPPDEAVAAEIAAALWVGTFDADQPTDPWHSLGGFRVTPHFSPRTVHLESRTTHDISLPPLGGVPPLAGRGALSLAAETAMEPSFPPPVGKSPVGVVDLVERRVSVVLDGHTFTFRVLTRTERWSPATQVGHGPAGSITAPFPGVVAEVRVDSGDIVEAGQVLAVLEAMKMLHPLTAPGAGAVADVRIAPGDSVASDQILITFENGESE